MYNNKYKIFITVVTLILFISLFSLSSTFGHVTLLNPQGGEVLEGDSDFTIKWDIDEAVGTDENWDIRFSRDNGENWEVVTANLRSTSRSFDWQVPNINTNTGRIEVIQDLPGDDDDGARSEQFTINKIKSFSFNCEDKITKWGLGLEKIILEYGNEQSCTLQLTNFNSGSTVEILTKTRAIDEEIVEVFPKRGITDENGTLEIKMRGINQGINWVSWAVRNKNGKFRFTKKAYEEGITWGMFVEVK